MIEKVNSLGFNNRIFAFRFFLVTCVQNVISFLLGGEKCLCCSKWTLRLPLCSSCLTEIFRPFHSESCSVCGKPLVSERGLCTVCREEAALKSIDAAFSLHCYQLWKKSLLFAWKMEGKRSLSPYFAALCYKKIQSLWQKEGQQFPLVPVPPRAGKIRERGWDQIDDLCFYLRKGWNVKILPLLERLSRTQQKKLDRAQRLEGIESSYRLKSAKRLKGLIRKIPETVMLIDDVLTTGSTVEACARELKKLGVKKVFSLTLFIVD